MQLWYKEVEKIYIFNHYLESTNFSWHLSYMQKLILSRVKEYHFIKNIEFFLISLNIKKILNFISLTIVWVWILFFWKLHIYLSVKGIELSLHLYKLQRERIISWNHNKLTYTWLYININITIYVRMHMQIHTNTKIDRRKFI